MKIRINEQELKKLIYESVKEVLTEGYDFNEIGQINYSYSFDEEEYMDWLEWEELEKSDETLLQFYKEAVTYNLDLLDSDTYHHMAYQDLTYDEIIDEYGERIADRILDDCMEDGEGYLEIGEILADDIDIHNPEELNAEAMKLLKNGRYFKGARGYILTNGVVVYTEAEHNMASIINGVDGTFHFISLGNIRVLPNGIDLAAKPTPQQERVLMQVIKAYTQETLYVDYMNTKIGNISKTYNRPNYEMVMRDINKVFN